MSASSPDDEYWMRQALAAAQAAAARGEVPVGAVVVRQGQLVATGGNAPIQDHDPTAHAEIAALRAAARQLENYRLDDCELYVTLEPCAMCAGAMLHARLKRVVFGASEPRTGAAGSVINLFADPALNHQTQLVGNVLASECGALLQSFFRVRRGNGNPLREDALRTPDAAFAHLPDYPWAPRYVSDLPSLAGLRMHYVDEGLNVSAPQGRTWLCLHGYPGWSYSYRHLIATMVAAGDRVVVPDMPGFGKSDKPKRETAHSFSWHRQILLELIERLDLKNIILVVRDWGGVLGLTLPMAMPERFAGLLAVNTMLATGEEGGGREQGWPARLPNSPDKAVETLARSPHVNPAELTAWRAPFPDRGHHAALHAFTRMLPVSARDDGAALSRAARQFWRQEWSHPSLLLSDPADPLFGTIAMDTLCQDIRACDEVSLEHAQAQLAEHALKYFGRTR